MAVVSVLTTIWFQPSKTAFFDKRSHFDETPAVEAALGAAAGYAPVDPTVAGSTPKRPPTIDPLSLQTSIDDPTAVDENGNPTKRSTGATDGRSATTTNDGAAMGGGYRNPTFSSPK